MNIPFVHHIEERTIEQTKQYFQPETIIEYCKQCQYYNRIWTCPPYDFDTAEILEKYKYAYIIGSKLYIDRLSDDFKELLNNKDLMYVYNEIYMAARAVFDKKLAKLANKNKDICVLFPGRCLECKECTREKQMPCVCPEKAHLSLESIGYHVSALCEGILDDKILWVNESLPEYLILVSAVLSKERLDIQDIYSVL